PDQGDPGPEAAVVRETLARVRRDVDEAMREFAFQRALVAIWEFIAIVNGYVDAVQPWALARDPARRARLHGALYTLAESLRCLAILLGAFLPEAAAKIRGGLDLEPQALDALEWGRLKPGTTVAKAPALVPTILTETIAGETREKGSTTMSAPGPPHVTIDDFGRLELRVALVLAAEPV